jgi:hypothetical protein
LVFISYGILLSRYTNIIVYTRIPTDAKPREIFPGFLRRDLLITTLTPGATIVNASFSNEESAAPSQPEFPFTVPENLQRQQQQQQQQQQVPAGPIIEFPPPEEAVTTTPATGEPPSVAARTTAA